MGKKVFIKIFEKIFSKMLDYFRNFRKLNPSKISHFTVSEAKPNILDTAVSNFYA